MRVQGHGGVGFADIATSRLGGACQAGFPWGLASPVLPHRRTSLESSPARWMLATEREIWYREQR